MHRLLIYLSLSLSIVGCATGKPASEQYESDEQKFYASFLEELFTVKGANILCSQKAFTLCFGRTNEKCLSDLSPFSAQCVETSMAEVNIIKEEKLEPFVKAYIICMTSKSLVSQASSMEETSSCIAQNEADEEAMIRSLSN